MIQKINLSNSKNTSSLSVNANPNDRSNAKADRYYKIVRKAVTSKNLPSINKLIISKDTNTNTSSFLKKPFHSSNQLNSLNKLIVSPFSNEDKKFVIFITGSKDTEYALELAAKRISIISNDLKFILIYITPTPAEDKIYNYRNKKDVIINNYENTMINLNQDSFYFYTEERNSKGFSHAIQQVEVLCEKYSSRFLLTGFQALKGPRSDNQLMDKGLKIMLSSNFRPFIIIKESLAEKLEENKQGLNWLFIFDKVNIRCYNSFKKFSELVDFSKDKVSAYTLLPNNEVSVDDIEKVFNKEFEKNQEARLEYEIQRYDNDSYTLVNKKINFGQIRYDFVVLYNNISYSDYNRKQIEKQMLNNIQIILGASSNFCVLNGN